MESLAAIVLLLMSYLEIIFVVTLLVLFVTLLPNAIEAIDNRRKSKMRHWGHNTEREPPFQGCMPVLIGLFLFWALVIGAVIQWWG